MKSIGIHAKDRSSRGIGGVLARKLRMSSESFNNITRVQGHLQVHNMADRKHPLREYVACSDLHLAPLALHNVILWLPDLHHGSPAAEIAVLRRALAHIFNDNSIAHMDGLPDGAQSPMRKHVTQRSAAPKCAPPRFPRTQNLLRLSPGQPRGYARGQTESSRHIRSRLQVELSWELHGMRGGAPHRVVETQMWRQRACVDCGTHPSVQAEGRRTHEFGGDRLNLAGETAPALGVRQGAAGLFFFRLQLGLGEPCRHDLTTLADGNRPGFVLLRGRRAGDPADSRDVFEAAAPCALSVGGERSGIEGGPALAIHFFRQQASSIAFVLRIVVHDGTGTANQGRLEGGLENMQL
mmetsp:Transcript_172662/g.553358  ORF Transcript_172662/g.553358 Transcript_172662/m.553358 type:complete len:352 (+) Transcript_172662:2404-3459(+)